MASDNSKKMSAPSVQKKGLDSRSLARKIFEADVPEEYIKTIPPQALYMAIKINGIHSASDVIEIATPEQCRFLLDFDLWEKDRLNEDNLWEWLALPEDTNDLEILKKVLKSIDLKIIALLVGRHTKIEVFEEPTDEPPGPNHYTPDKGYTWIHITTEDSTKHFLLARLLALMFETDAKTFYQLISVPQIATASVLEEDSFQDRSKRIAAEGIPEPDYAQSINAPLDEKSAAAEIKSETAQKAALDISPVHPLVYETIVLEPLGTLFASVKDLESFEAEVTLIMNAAVVHFGVPFYEHEDILALSAQVRGAMNIGLERAMAFSEKSAVEAYEILGLQKIYRIGLSKLFGIRRVASDVERSLGDSENAHDPLVLALLDATTRPFPAMPEYLKDDGTFEAIEGKLSGGTRAIETVSACDMLSEKLKRLLH